MQQPHVSGEVDAAARRAQALAYLREAKLQKKRHTIGTVLTGKNPTGTSAPSVPSRQDELPVIQNEDGTVRLQNPAIARLMLEQNSGFGSVYPRSARRVRESMPNLYTSAREKEKTQK